MRAVIHGNNTVDGVYITLRMHLRCEVFRNGKAMPGKVIDVLNEVVVDRGSNPYLSKIECYEHDRLITKVRNMCLINLFAVHFAFTMPELFVQIYFLIVSSLSPFMCLCKCSSRKFGISCHCLSW